MRRPGFANDTGELLAALPAVQERASKAFPHAEAAIEDFQPNLRLHRAPTRPTSSTASASWASSPATTTATATTPAPGSPLNLFRYDADSGELEPIPPSEQYDAFGGSTGVRRPCPGAATQPAPDGSNPFTEPPFAGAGVTTSECDPADAPPGP